MIVECRADVAVIHFSSFDTSRGVTACRVSRQLKRLVSLQNDYLTTRIISKTSEMINEADEIESASSVLFEIILAAIESSFI